MSRIDLSEWIIHFVHDRNPENDPLCFAINPDTVEFFDFPDYFAKDGKPATVKFYDDEDYPIEDDAGAFSVLEKILHDGYLKSGWSFRNYKPTIYGPSSAVCFTEMPLYALIDYAHNRSSNSSYVENYGIAFRKNELFKAGARPVIYGLSTKHIEADENDPFFKSGGGALRLLSTTGTGLSPIEQYRYVYTNLSQNIDWTHEREWRWPLRDEKLGVAGLPFLLCEDYADFFSEIIIIVSTDTEKTYVLKKLKYMYDSGGTNRGYRYNTELIKKVKVLSIESLSRLPLDPSKIRIEDIPFTYIHQMKEFIVKPEIMELVKKTWDEACDIARKASQDYFTNSLNNEDIGKSGFANVSTYEISEITQAFLNLGIAHTYSDSRYILDLKRQLHVQNIDTHEVGAIEAAKYLTQKLGQNFHMTSNLD